MRNALHSSNHPILSWLAVVAMCALAFLVLAMPAPARVDPPKAQAQPTATAAATPVTIDGIDVEYLPARFYEEQKRAAMQEPAPTF